MSHQPYKQADYYGGGNQGYQSQQPYGNTNQGYQQAPPPQSAYQQVPQDASGYQGHTSPTYAQTGSPVYGKNHEHTLQGEPLYGNDFSGGSPELQRFRVAGWQDTWAMALFYIQFLACIIVAGINIGNSKFSTTTNDNNTNGGTPAPGYDTTVTFDVSETAKTFAKSAGAGLGFAIILTIILLGMIKAFPASFIWIAQGFFILLWAAYAGVGFYLGSTIMGVIGIILCLLTCAWLFCIRNRIPFSALLLESSANCIMRFSGTIVLAFVALIFAVVYFCFWAMMTIPTLAKFEDSQNNNVYATGGLTFLLLLMFFWTQQVTQGVVHCTSAGAVATWYFVGENQTPPNPAWAAFKRAMSTSFGSICFGALIVAILKTIEAFARAAYRNNRNSIGACIALCVISCVERLMEYFNQYALCFVAIYGCSYIEAAKETWNMIMNGSIWAGVINDILVDRVFAMVMIFEGALCGVICYFLFDKQWVAAVGGALIGLLVSGVVFNTVASGCTTLLVCVADAPEVFQNKHPELAGKITHAIKQLRKGCCDSSDSA